MLPARVMLCLEVMKEPVECAAPWESVQSAARRMRDRGIGFLPVCGASGAVVGTLTDRDITVRVTSENLDAARTMVGQVMTREVVACRPEDDLGRAELLMSVRHKSRILCIDDQGVLVGVISLSDIACREGSSRVAVTLRHLVEREVRG